MKLKLMKLTAFSSSPLLSKGFDFPTALYTNNETVLGISFLSIFKQYFNHFLAFHSTILPVASTI
jgi:hypothetical protein